MRWSSTFSALHLLSSTPTSIDAFLSRHMPTSNGSFTRNGGASVQRATNDIEPYVGPVGSIGDMEGGIAVGDLALQVLVAPSLVANGNGLFLCIDNSDDDADESGSVEEIIIPQGTPICGYARGYFTDEEDGDKSVGFLFGENSADVTAVFYNKQLMTLSDALWTAYQERCTEGNPDSSGLLFGHQVEIDADTGGVSIKADKDFFSRIFIPEIKEEDQFSATSLGVYANDLAYDPDSTEEQYFENSERNNILQLVWRLAKDEKNGMIVPTWPVVIARQDVRLLNTVPMEVGLQYGFNYWNAVTKEGASKYIK
mmetsp:Transcript_3135/g.5706  ORF Transcript_3135/g.5706 Transcript_3135/m.5706 type:complete len:312 (-) Transcript_3135:221-1156(-)|eukprot:CAMPEP_0198280928 /NCGR_PEP_ID=MMETSP1449-20131203/962_1 /TAXON_ID=420275 /ORGANISM="Attheya septentrionalis, Strain CCMP2084" /LENGTH=311 /DNA_ID=CAMNT_0043976507 /DNA_START=120 /DNA_END=1055 /DNA_ORIENTATION=-